MIISKRIIETDPVIKLIVFCLLFYFLSNINILSSNNPPPYLTKQESDSEYMIEIQREGAFPVVYRFNKSELKSAALPSSIIDSKIITGTKYYLDKSDKVYKTSGISARHKISLGIPIDINSAVLEDLTALPGIGQVTAQRIIDHRKSNGRFKDKQSLIQVEGIGSKTYERIEKYLTY